MATHRYFFWIESGEIEVYKNGRQVLYKGEKKIDYSNGIENFFEIWKENSAYIDGELVDFTFLGFNKEELNKFMKFCEKFLFDVKLKFTFEDLKNILDNKNLKQFCIEIEKKQYFLQKTDFIYNKIPKNKNLKTIYIHGKNIKENFLAEGTVELEIKSKDKLESKMAAFFRNRL